MNLPLTILPNIISGDLQTSEENVRFLLPCRDYPVSGHVQIKRRRLDPGK